MNGHWLLNLIATSVKNTTVFYLDYYIQAAFLLALVIIVCMLLQMKLRSSHMQQWHL